MELIKNCSLEDHKEIEANIYCPECQIYMCKKCENIHNTLFKNHHAYNTDKNNEEIFTGFCKEKNHHIELKYYCKNHNTLCCAACIAKINKIGDGQHNNCDVCIIQEIKEEKRNKFKDNEEKLKQLNDKLKDSLIELKDLFEKIEKDKDELKLHVQKIFTRIRTVLNEREDELLNEIDKYFNNHFFDENVLKEGEKLPNKIKNSLKRVNSMDKEWDDINLNKYINNCIMIENDIEKINLINQQINKCLGNDTSQIIFFPNEDNINIFLAKIKSFGKIDSIDNNHYNFRECPKGVGDIRKYILKGNNKNIITKIGPGGDFAGTITQNELDKNIDIHKWKISILKTKAREINIGIATDEFNQNSPHWNKGYFLYCKNSTLYSMTCSGKNKKIDRVENEVIIEMNMKTRILKFIVNGNDQIDAYTDIPLDKPLFPAVILYDKDDSVEITKC